MSLILGLEPTAPTPRALRDPPVFIKGASPEKVRKNATQIAAVVDAMAVRYTVKAVFLHQDCDAVEPAHEAVAADLEQAMARAGVDNAHGVAPAWEMEAWWFLWPDAAVGVRASWRRPDDHIGRHVGRIRNAKEQFKKAVRPRGLNKKGRRVEDYHESDAPAIAEQVRALGLVTEPAGRSDSFERFRGSVRKAFGGRR